MNDKISENECNFHPFKCKRKSGVGKYLYSAEWHSCKESCNFKKSDGCVKLRKHYYGSHLPYESCEEGKREKKAYEFIKRVKREEKEVMTDISLMFNPFKTGSKYTPLKDRSNCKIDSIYSSSIHKSQKF